MADRGTVGRISTCSGGEERSPSITSTSPPGTALRDWLTKRGLGQYAPNFAERGFDDLEDLRQWTEDDPEAVRRIVYLEGHWLKLKRCLAQLSRVGSAEGHASLSPDGPGMDRGSCPDLSLFVRTHQQDREAAGGPKSPSETAAIAVARELTATSSCCSPGDPAAALGVGPALRVLRRPSDMQQPQRVMSREINLKVVIVGAGDAGKTSFVRRLVNNTFTSNIPTTIGVDFSSKRFQVDQSLAVVLQLWDIHGQPQVPQVGRVVIQGAKGAIVAYDVTKPGSLYTAIEWKRELDNKLGNGSSGFVYFPTILVGNKCDLQPHKDVTETRMQEFCNEHKFVGHFFTSAKTGHNVLEAAEFLVQAMLKNETSVELHARNLHDVVTLDLNRRPQKSKTKRKGEAGGANKCLAA